MDSLHRIELQKLPTKTALLKQPETAPSTAAVKWSCLVVWLTVVAAVALLEVQRRQGTLHPVFIPFLSLVGLALAAAIVGLSLAGWHLWRASGHWKKVSLWAGAIAMPLFLFGVPFVQASRQWAQWQVPHGASAALVIVTAAGLMEGQATYFYPHRVETDRLVMFYRELARPQLDAETMERHVALLEKKMGSPLRSKIHWVRGSLLKQGHCSFLGLALGSTRSPGDWSGPEGSLDRHELAHAVIVQQRPVSADPPMVLHEGWAESQSGASSQELAALALDELRQNPDLQLIQLFGPDWYHYEAKPVYTFGGAFVDFLIRRFGSDKFVNLYNRCQPNTFEADFRAVYGQSVSDLESTFWEDVRRIVR
jgi:hypothetical protein